MKSKDAPKLLGSAEWKNGRLSFRLSRTADPTRRRYWVDDYATPDVKIATLEDARRLAHRLSVRALDDKIGPSRAVARGAALDTCDEWFEKWFKDRESREAVTTSRHDRGRYTTHVGPIIGTWRMASLPREKIEEVVAALDAKILIGKKGAPGGLSWKTAATTWGTISKAFKDACGGKATALRVRADNPTIGVAPPERGGKKSKAFLYPSEFWDLITSRALTHGEGLPAHVAANVANASRRWLRSFALAAYLGTRAGELAVLEWSDVDLKHWTVTIHRAAVRDSGRKKIKGTKTEAPRSFEIEPALRPLLLAMHREQGKPATGAIINLPHECDLSSRLVQYLKWAGVKRPALYARDATRCPVTFKDLRATYCTWRAIRGDDPLKIQRAAGHTSLNTTQIYIREAEDLGGRAGQPFPPLPAFLLGETATQGAHLESVGKRARPPAGPQLAPKSSKSTKLLAKEASPAGFERAQVAISTGKLGHWGPIDPPNDPKRARTIGARGSATARAIEAALMAALADGQPDDAADLASELARVVARRHA